MSGDREMAWLSSGIAETVTNDLRAMATHRVIDRVRVVEAVRRGGADLSALRAELHLDRAVVGSFQRAGDRLRITARIVDADSGETQAEAKADGALDRVFELQDRVVMQFADALGTSRRGSGGRRSLGDTSSLEAYRAFTEGRVKLESLDSAVVPAAIADFELAVKLDPQYAGAHVGLANARFWQYRGLAGPQSAGRRPARHGDRSRPPRHRAGTRSRGGARNPVVPPDERAAIHGGTRRRPPGGGAGTGLLGEPVPSRARGVGR